MINAAAAQTLLGGALMPVPVLAAMHEAAQWSVYLPDLHDRVGERIAALTHNEAACVSCGAAAGILVAVAACMAGDKRSQATALPDTSSLPRTEVISFRGHDNGFLSAARETGATLIEVGGDPEALQNVISARTAAILWFAGDFWDDDALPLCSTIDIAHQRGIPVIVDAADQIPPIANLWRFTRDDGVDLAIFSGGKGLRGPQASGLIVGRADLIRGCRANSGPLDSIARPAKVGKEEMVGLLAAIEWSVALNENDVALRYDKIVASWIDGLRDLPGITVTRTARSHSGQPIARAIVTFDTSRRRDALMEALWRMTPRIAVLAEGERAIGLNPQLLAADQPAFVLTALRQTITEIEAASHTELG